MATTPKIDTNAARVARMLVRRGGRQAVGMTVPLFPYNEHRRPLNENEAPPSPAQRPGPWSERRRRGRQRVEQEVQDATWRVQLQSQIVPQSHDTATALYPSSRHR